MPDQTNGMDPLNLAILRELQRDGRLANVDLAGRVGLSPSATLERVRRLERDGMITGYAAQVDPRALGPHMMVFVAIWLREHHKDAIQAFEHAVATIPEVLECYHVAGDADFQLKLVVRDVSTLRDTLVECISQIANVGRINSSLILSVTKQARPVPIAGS